MSVVFLKQFIKEYQDFPKPGILFQDLTPIYQNIKAFDVLLDLMQKKADALGSFDFIAGIEARGFILGAALAERMGLGFIPVRKKGKLPGKLKTVEYSLEYGTDCLEIQENDDLKGARVLLIDDVFATGGTLKAVISLFKECVSYLAVGIVMDIQIADIDRLDADWFTVL